MISLHVIMLMFWISLVFHCAIGSRLVCYFPSWARYRTGSGGAGQLTTDKLDPNLCTHIIYAFAWLNGETYEIMSGDTRADIYYKGYENLAALKTKNEQLKVMISFGGWTDSNKEPTGKYLNLVSNTNNTDTFINSVINFLRRYNFDGIDVAWEPQTFEPKHKAGLAKLVAALKKALKPLGFLLSALVSAHSHEIDNGYDVPSLNLNLDFINMKTYELHAPSWEQDVAYHHAPLRKKSSDPNDLNAIDSVNFWIKKGFSATKINLGIPLYGNSWTLSSNNTKPPALAAGAGAPGKILNETGKMAYYEICGVVRNDGWTVIRDPSKGIGPYAFSPTSPINWVGYDDPAMAVVKTEYILSDGLGGASVWDMSYDDFRGSCGSGANPIMSAIFNTLNGLPWPRPTNESADYQCKCDCDE